MSIESIRFVTLYSKILSIVFPVTLSLHNHNPTIVHKNKKLDANYDCKGSEVISVQPT